MKLELPNKKHENQYFEMIQEFLERNEKIIPEIIRLRELETYDGFLERTKEYREGKNILPQHVTSTSYFLINENDKLVGVIDIRHELNERLRKESGHIGYGIKPSERRKGYASIGLKLALEKCKELGLDKVQLSCYKDNVGSSKTIRNNGGELDREYEINGRIRERYKITT